ncbi:sulfite oxidase [Actinocorallia populi]|uniref:sulfite oxidase n=1 Tax=Actinocorallia populi TaxID=2079200 RepID=UPI000D08D588|nr:sulfite oxidase [Actinocorallia populi]
MDHDLTDESVYDAVRARQWSRMSRRGLLRGSAALGAGLAFAGAAPSPARAAGPIVKPLPPEWFVSHGTNAELRWESVRTREFLTPAERFFVRNHTATPEIDPDAYRLRLWGDGLRGAPGPGQAVEFGYGDLRSLPAETVTAAIECTGNARGFFTTQQGQAVSGTPWRLGAIGVGRWRGVPLATVLRHAGLTPEAVDVLPSGLDAEYVDKGVVQGRVRRPLPVSKALEDVLLAYELNGRPLPPDHGFPVRVVVPGWAGIASIKWVGDIQVAAEPLFSPWNTRYYRLFGAGHPPEGSEPVTRQNVKSAFELAWDAEIPARRRVVLTGRSWSGGGRIRRVEVSVDEGASWRPAVLERARARYAWQRWRYVWERPAKGSHVLLARAVDETGAVQPDTEPHNTLGYLFGAVVRHPVTVV